MTTDPFAAHKKTRGAGACRAAAVVVLAASFIMPLTGIAQSTQSTQSAKPATSETPETSDPLNARDLSIELVSDKTEARINEQILLTRTVRAGSAVFNLTGGKLTIDGADLIALRHTEATRTDGTAIRITRWAVFARQTGILKIDVQPLQATLPASAGSNATATARPQPPRVAIAATTKEAIAANKVPARGLRISHQWVQPIDDWRAGEPRTLKIRLEADGQRAAAISPLKFQHDASIRVYPKPARLDDKLTERGIVGIRSETIDIVPADPGAMRLLAHPARWFNTNTRAAETTEFKTIDWHVLPALLASGQTTTATGLPGYSWINRVLALIGGLLAVAILWLAVRQLNKQRSSPRNGLQAWRQLNRSLKHNDDAASRNALIRWAQFEWPARKIQRIEHLIQTIADPTVSAELKALEARLFAREPTANAGGLIRLRESLLAWRHHRAQRDRANAGQQEAGRIALRLKALYPQE